MLEKDLINEECLHNYQMINCNCWYHSASDMSRGKLTNVGPEILDFHVVKEHMYGLNYKERLFSTLCTTGQNIH